MADDSEDAARWFAAERRGIMSTEELRDYERWAADPVHAAALDRMRLLWETLAPATMHAAPPVAYLRIPRTQMAALVGIISLVVAILTRLDSIWWNSLDWWSR